MSKTECRLFFKYFIFWWLYDESLIRWIFYTFIFFWVIKLTSILTSVNAVFVFTFMSIRILSFLIIWNLFKVFINKSAGLSMSQNHWWVIIESLRKRGLYLEWIALNRSSCIKCISWLVHVTGHKAVPSQRKLYLY